MTELYRHSVHRCTYVYTLFSMLLLINSSAILPVHVTLKSDQNSVTSQRHVGGDSTRHHHRDSHRDSSHGNHNSQSSRLASQLRPSPSDELPILPLPNDGNLPQESDLDPRRLERILGKHYDKDFMSVLRPLDSILHPNGTLHYDFKNGHPAGSMPQQIKRMRFSVPGRKANIRIQSKRTRRRVRKFLWAYGHCPVKFVWKDLGEKFWPRWIREGDCYNGRSCSIPAGMSCKLEQSTSVTILWWHCRRKSHCKWIHVPYPIITKCTCSC